MIFMLGAVPRRVNGDKYGRNRQRAVVFRKRRKPLKEGQASDSNGASEELQDLNEGHPRTIANALYFLVFCLFGLVIAFTLPPYIKFVKLLVGIPAIGEMLSDLAALPLVGGLFNFVGGIAATVAGIILFAVVQFMEIWELSMTLSPTHMARLVGAGKNAPAATDASKRAQLQRKHQLHPTEALRLAMVLRAAALLIELAIGWMVVPPVEGGVFQFFALLVTLQFNKINWANLAVMWMLLFALEGCYRLYVKVRDWRYHNKIYDEKES